MPGGSGPLDGGGVNETIRRQCWCGSPGPAVEPGTHFAQLAHDCRRKMGSRCGTPDITAVVTPRGAVPVFFVSRRRATSRRVHSDPKSSRHGGRQSRIVIARPSTSISTRISLMFLPITSFRLATNRRTRAMSVSGSDMRTILEHSGQPWASPSDRQPLPTLKAAIALRPWVDSALQR